MQASSNPLNIPTAPPINGNHTTEEQPQIVIEQPKTVAQQPKKPVPPAPEAPEFILAVPQEYADKINNTPPTEAAASFPGLLGNNGNNGLPRSDTSGKAKKPAPPKRPVKVVGKPIVKPEESNKAAEEEAAAAKKARLEKAKLTKKSKDEREAKKAAYNQHAVPGSQFTEEDPTSQYDLVSYDGEIVGLSRCDELKASCSSFKANCQYGSPKSFAISLGDFVLSSAEAFPMGYLLAEYLIPSNNMIVGAGFAGYLLHNGLEKLASNEKGSLVKALTDRQNQKRAAAVGLFGLGTSILTQQFIVHSGNEAAIQSCDVAHNIVLPAAAMWIANYSYKKYISQDGADLVRSNNTQDGADLVRSNNTHFIQKAAMIGLDMVKTIGFSLAFHDGAKYSTGDARDILSHCVEFGLASMTALKLCNVAKFYLSKNQTERETEIKSRGGRVRILFPEILGYVVTALAYGIAIGTEHLGFSADSAKCLQDTPDQVAAKTAKLMAVYGMFRLAPEWILDRARAKAKHADVSNSDARTPFLSVSGKDLEGNPLDTTLTSDEEPVTSYLPPPVRSLNGNSK